MTDIYKCEKCGKIFDEFEMNYKEAQKDKKCLCRSCRAEEMTPEEVKEKIKKIKEGGKNEKCHYCLSDDFEEEVGEFKVLIEGELKRVHRQCYNRHLTGESNIRIIIK